MEFIKSYSRRSFVLILVLGIILMAATLTGFHFVLEFMYRDISLLATPETPSMALIDPDLFDSSQVFSVCCVHMGRRFYRFRYPVVGQFASNGLAFFQKIRQNLCIKNMFMHQQHPPLNGKSSSKIHNACFYTCCQCFSGKDVW